MLRLVQACAKLAEDRDPRKPSERATKLMAGVTQGARGMGPAEVVGLVGLGSLPLVRHLVSNAEGYPQGTVPQTQEELQAFLRRLAEGEDFNENLKLKLVSRPGQAAHSRSLSTILRDRNHETSTRPFPETLGKDTPMPERVHLAIGSNPQTIAHELGHALHPSRLSNAMNIVGHLARHPVALAIPSVLALSGGLSNDEETPTWAKAAPYLGGAQVAAVLGEETRANINALRLLKSKGIPLTTLQKLRQFAPSLSYLGLITTAVGAPLGILKGLDLYEKSRKTDHPFTFKQVVGVTPKTLSEAPSTEDVRKKWQHLAAPPTPQK